VEEFDVFVTPPPGKTLVGLDRIGDGIPDPAGAPAF